MQLGLVGLGRMGASMARRLVVAGHEVVGFDRDAARLRGAAEKGVRGAATLSELVSALSVPRAVWLMLPVEVVEGAIEDLGPLLAKGDIVIDGGNSHYADDIRRAADLGSRGLHLVDVGTSGGVWGDARGYCQMIGGEAEVVDHLTPIFASLAPDVDGIARTPGRSGSATPAERGYLHCGSHGAGHFVKMVHNGIEYGLMAAYAEGLNILRNANVGKRPQGAGDAETTPLPHPERYEYDFDLAAIAEVWRRGSVVSSWLLDLTAASLLSDPALDRFAGRVSDSGEGRWALTAAIDEGVPAPVLSMALCERFTSRGDAEFAYRALSAMRLQFGGHQERK